MWATRDTQSPLLKGENLISTNFTQARIKPQIADLADKHLYLLGSCTPSSQLFLIFLSNSLIQQFCIQISSSTNSEEKVDAEVKGDKQS